MDLARFALTIALRAGDRRGARFGARTSTGLALFIAGDLDFFFDTKGRFFEGQLNPAGEICTAAGGIANASAAHTAKATEPTKTEQPFEDV